MALSHTFSCTVADSTNTAQVRPSDWNAAHTIGAGTAANGLVPIGGLAVWAGLVASPPTGWFICDGSAKSEATYADLFGVIAHLYGDPGSGNFNLPDLRDKFVVGAKQDDSGVPKSNIRGSLEQSITVTGVTLTHAGGAVGDHTGLTHAGASVAGHPDLTHAALAIADHPSMSLTISIGAQGTIGRSGTATASPAVSVSTHAWTNPTAAAVSHNISVGAGTHASAGLTHAVTQPDAHGAAGTVTHSFTPPNDHSGSIVPAFLAMAYIIRYA